MDFSLSPGLKTACDEASSLVREQLIPLEPLLLSHDYATLMGELEEVRQSVRELGLWAPHLPTELGGMGLSLLEFAQLAEVLGYSPLGHFAFGCQAPDAGNAELLLHCGTAEQRSRYLEPLAKGEIRSCFAMTERQLAGSNPLMMNSEAEFDGDCWHLNAHKWFTTAAEGAEFAIVMAKTHPEAPPHQQASMLLVPMDAPGVTRIRNISVMGGEGHGPFSHAEMLFDDVKLPADALVGKAGQGFALAQARLGPGRIHHCMRWLGLAQRALDETTGYLNQRAITAQKTLGEQPLAQGMLAEAAAAHRAARWFVLHTAWQVDKEDFATVRAEIAMIKFHTARMLQQVVDTAVQLHGGLGVTDDTILAFLYREERAARIYDGPDEVHKLSAAKHLLRAHR
ncbi:acyl-CoA dehydrogenase family protein [Ferrimonas sp. YFM]|uniref:acyl-CoA dehydrogenase family protein n=1 Tax=Ferrimonas sp. YFM TaxID=3028878 RepID=UPI0025739023|nr:acyl-CoA dehydrogenase family protein [Ferrimonas sp. YFM]BDY04545.1 acyl-CoA dehydrogenase [Ferrimonas sp. YFM]